MLYQEREPTRALAAVIKHFWELKGDGASSEPEIILPDGCPELVFNLSDRFEQGSIAISNLSHTLNTSERSLERIFRERVGLSPKKFARIVRFQNILRTIENVPDSKMLDAALTFGYFDQSHMIRDFREFSGKSPQDYFNQTHRLSALFTAST